MRFEYGLSSMRQMATYGGKLSGGSATNFNSGTGKFTKYYSEDGSFEIVRNNQSGREKHILYIGGDPYESNIVYLKDFSQSSGSYKFLHKDYLGSILAISDEAGNLVEERHFDAWGVLTGGAMNLLDRGYTGHEHFDEVGIIHMNGRIYDPLLRRFMNPDPHIQEPTNTQNYNKYAYVLNNPLLYNDPSGERGLLGFIADVFTAILISVATVITIATVAVLYTVIAPISIPLAIFSVAVAVSAESYLWFQIGKLWGKASVWFYKHDSEGNLP